MRQLDVDLKGWAPLAEHALAAAGVGEGLRLPEAGVDKVVVKDPARLALAVGDVPDLRGEGDVLLTLARENGWPQRIAVGEPSGEDEGCVLVVKGEIAEHWRNEPVAVGHEQADAAGLEIEAVHVKRRWRELSAEGIAIRVDIIERVAPALHAVSFFKGAAQDRAREKIEPGMRSVPAIDAVGNVLGCFGTRDALFLPAFCAGDDAAHFRCGGVDLEHDVLRQAAPIEQAGCGVIAQAGALEPVAARLPGGAV